MSLILNQKNDILEQIFTQLKTHFLEKEQKTLQLFINSVYRDVVIRDLIQMSQEDLNGLTVSLWREIQQWKGEKAKIRVFNPDVEQDEWQSAHTVINILSPKHPFVIDTLKLILNEENIKLHHIFFSEIATVRNKSGKLISLDSDNANELLLYFEIDHTSSKKVRDEISKKMELALENVSLVVNDFEALKSNVNEAIEFSKKDKFNKNIIDIDEQQAFLTFLLDNNFTFIGGDKFSIIKGKAQLLENSQLGLLKNPDFLQNALPFELLETLQEPSLLHFSKASERAMVHRSVYPDVIYVKHFNASGELLGGYRFIGLYTSAVYSGTPLNIPIVRNKIKNILKRADYRIASHYYKELVQILCTYPVEDLLLCDESTLLKNVTEVLHAQERKEIKLFLRCAANKQFVIATIYVPRDIYNTNVRIIFEKLICRSLDVDSLDYQTYLSESSLARLRLVLRLKSPLNKVLEEQLMQDRMKQLTKRWDDDLHQVLIERFGEEKGIKLSHKYQLAFPTGYQDIFSSRIAVADIERMESLYNSKDRSMTLRFYRSIEANSSDLKLKLFHQNGALLLSDLIPILENLGLKVAEEYPYKVMPVGEKSFWLYDFTLIYKHGEDFDADAYNDIFTDAFLSIWYGETENDPFNKLILGAGMSWREVSVLRAYAKYLKQICFGFSHYSIAKTLLLHTELVKDISQLFLKRFDLKNPISLKEQEKRQNEIITSLNDVTNLNEDRVLRKYVELIMATLRTNYFQLNEGKNHDYISFKFDHNKITDLPLPRLKYEIFVYSTRFEGVHLRGGKVARGGMRWSDRGEDFRTEVLGLVKAQQVKNSVIVPVGAKGGFFAKRLRPTMNREEFMSEGIHCYKMFVSALLDMTDNLNKGEIVAPHDMIRYDGDDPYLVVAADKGTATFSDIANALATDRNFWLNDAFASGGSHGFDHKKMGITARGAWISVQRHFRELGINVQEKMISVIGIGDMGGDVFGNGMIRSKSIALLGAFNHLHIFIDPAPKDLEACYKERLRLFKTPRTGWNDYNKDLISMGGGIYDRTAKSIKVTPEMAKRFDIYQKQVTPTELINFLLKAQVDLLWNGGIGTYVKGEMESHANVGDKANDLLRVNGNELRCLIVGEGGNLGFTQSARIEYSLKGGLCFTDAIDNAGGVNCSDLEVNVKILLDKIVSKGDLTVKQRNIWLGKMTSEVSSLVLKNNYRQAQSISIAFLSGYTHLEEYCRLISDLDGKGKLNRKLECIPSDDELKERKKLQKGLTRPGIAVMLSYAKNEMKEELAHAKISNDPYLLTEAEKIFPASLVKNYKNEIHQHPLIDEIVATQVSNDLFNIMGATFAHRIMSSSGCSFLELCKAWVAARDIFSLDSILEKIESLDNKVDYTVQCHLISELKEMVSQATRWLIRNHRDDLDTGLLINKYQDSVKEVGSEIDTVLIGNVMTYRASLVQSLTDGGVPKDLAHQLSSCDQIYELLSVISVADKLSIDAHLSAQVYFFIADKLQLFEVAKQLHSLPIKTHWQALAHEAMRDDLEWQHKRLTQTVLLEMKKDGHKGGVEKAFEIWEEQHENLVKRWYRMSEALLAVNIPEFSMCQVALRELLDLSSSS